MLSLAALEPEEVPMAEPIDEDVITQWRRRLMGLRSNPKATYAALSVMDASYVSATGEYIPRARVNHWSPVPEIDHYQYPIDTTPYRIAAFSTFLVTTYQGGPPVGWQPARWTIVHEEQPNSHFAFLGMAETFEPPAEVFDRAREWIAEKVSPDQF
jgi:hypothetical protein